MLYPLYPFYNFSCHSLVFPCWFLSGKTTPPFDIYIPNIIDLCVLEFSPAPFLLLPCELGRWRKEIMQCGSMTLLPVSPRVVSFCDLKTCRPTPTELAIRLATPKMIRTLVVNCPVRPRNGNG